MLVYVLHKREVRHFHVLVVQKRERNVQKIAKLLFCLLNLFFFYLLVAVRVVGS